MKRVRTKTPALRFSVEGRAVFCDSHETIEADGTTSMNIGFRLCTVDDHVPIGMASVIAKLLNQASKEGKIR